MTYRLPFLPRDDPLEEIEDRLAAIARILAGVRLELRGAGAPPAVADFLTHADECVARARRHLSIAIATAPAPADEGEGDE